MDIKNRRENNKVFIVRKKRGKIIQAFLLGEEKATVKRLIEKGYIEKCPTGYEVFSRETLENDKKQGEKARKEDYIKIDEAGYPYPNTAEYFRENHRHIKENYYEQVSKEILAWRSGMSEEEKEIRFLKEKKGLIIDHDNFEKYYTAPLWGSILSAPGNAVIIFYRIDKNEQGEIQDIDFNFCDRQEFDANYDVVAYL